MASTSTLPSKGAGFGADDFISFDFGGDDAADDSHVASAEAGPSTSSSRRPSRPSSPSGGGGGGGAGGSGAKKRKYHDEAATLDDGMTKKERERAAARGTPWSIDVNWGSARNAAQQLNRELIAFEAWLSPTRKEHACREMVISLIRNAIVSQWRDAKVHSFGSQDTELYLPQGDIDLVVVCPAMEYQRREGVLRSMAACLRRNNLATDVQVIAKAKVPIIKFVCTYGRYRCDISVNQINGLQAADWVNRMQSEMPAIRPLILITKHLLQQRGMSEVYTGGLGSFSVILMVINFVQVHPKIQRGEIDPCCNLGVLFLEFLELYGKNFGYDETGLTVLGGGGYFSKSRKGWVDQQKPYKLCIEDPQAADNDSSKGSYNILSIRSALSGAFDLLTSAVCQRGLELARGRGGGAGASIRGAAAAAATGQQHVRFDPDEEARAALLSAGSGSGATERSDRDPQSLLGSIIGVSRELTKARRDIAQLYDGGTLHAKLGRSPPGRSPSPGPSSSSRRRPPEPHYPPPSPAPPPPPGPPANAPRGPSASSRHASSGVDTVINIRGSARRGDKQSASSSSSSAAAAANHSTPKAAREKRKRGGARSDGIPGLRRSDSPVTIGSGESESDDDDDGDDEDSRYKVSRRAPPQRVQQRQKQPRRYVSEESESDESDSDGVVVVGNGGSGSSPEEGQVETKEPGGSSSSASARGLKRQRSRDYWLSKTYATTSRDEDDDDDDYQYASEA